MLEHFEAVEADFQSHYGLDLRDVLWGPQHVGVRRLNALVKGLPLQGVFFRTAATNGKSWTTTDELLSVLIEIVDHGNAMYYETHKKPTAEKWKSIEIHRPTGNLEPEPPKVSTNSEVYSALRDEVVWDEVSV